ncbi:MAG: TolC family protein [Blastochloris sp.]|nr:TolC family protein [Blastochloris sp.]
MPGFFALVAILVYSSLSLPCSAQTAPTEPLNEKLSPSQRLSPQAFHGEALSLSMCYELALLRMETLGLSEQDVRIAQARYREAIGAVLPSVKVIGEQYIFKDRGNDFGSPVSGGGFSSENLQPRQARVNLKVPLFSGLRDIEIARAARAEIDGNRLTAARLRQNLYLNVAESYYQTLNYEADLRLLASIEKTLLERNDVLEKRVKLGKSRDSEQFQARTTLAQARVSVEKTKGLLAATREMLAFLIGVPATQWNLQPDLTATPSGLELGSYLSLTANRPDVLAAVQSQRSARAQLSAAKGEHFPKVSFEGNYTFYDSDSQRDGDWSGFLTLEIPLFDGGSIEARVDQNKALFTKKKLDLSQLEREAERDVRTTFNQFNASLAELASLREAVKTAELNFQAQQSDYDLRVVNNLDVLDALQTLHDLRRNESAARTDVRLNLIKLYIAAGATGTQLTKK